MKLVEFSPSTPVRRRSSFRSTRTTTANFAATPKPSPVRSTASAPAPPGWSPRTTTENTKIAAQAMSRRSSQAQRRRLARFPAQVDPGEHLSPAVETRRRRPPRRPWWRTVTRPRWRIDRDRARRNSNSFINAGAAAPAAQPQRDQARFPAPAAATCRRSPASTPPSTAAIRRLPRAFAIPRALSAEGVKRYGFHGLSYEYIARVLPQNTASAPTAG